jgi:hypothetical protein
MFLELQFGAWLSLGMMVMPWVVFVILVKSRLWREALSE